MIRIEGLSLEKFLNIAASEGVYVVDAKRLSYTVLSAGVSARGYKKLCKLGDARYRITVQRKIGVPVGWQWILGRKVILFGLTVVALAAVAASLFVWDVKIEGVEESEAAAIKDELQAMGVMPGAYKGSIDLEQINIDLIIAHDEIAWLDVSYTGVIVLVDIVLAEPVPDIVDENTPCNVIAAKDAYIERVIALCGRPMVDPGDTVRAGDVLISGLIWDPGTKRMLFAARGEVVGNVWYTATYSTSIFEQSREKTGKTQTQRVMYIGPDSAEVDAACSFETFDTRVIREYYIADRLFLPVKVAVLEHSEVKIEQKPKSLNMLMSYLEERAFYDAKGQAGSADIVGHRTLFDIEDDTLTATVYLQTQEDIGRIVYLEE